MVRALHHDERIAREILGSDEPGRRVRAREPANPEAAALAERVAGQAAVTADHAAAVGLDRAGRGRQPAADEIPERALADEADAGRIALCRDRDPALVRDPAHFSLLQFADRELAGCKLRRIERMQEVALVLGAVEAAQQPAARAGARVVAGREAVRAEPSCIREADAELDLAVA